MLSKINILFLKWLSRVKKMAKQITLQNFLKDADERVRKAAADALNESAEMLESQIKKNMDEQGIKERKGNLRRSLKFSRATEKRLKVVIKSEVYAKNKTVKGRVYENGVPYGRILEFSPKISKPFFYTAWYKMRNEVKDKVMKEIGDAWSGN